MKLPDGAHTARPWRIHEIAADFDLLDVWALPTPGGADDFELLVEGTVEMDPGSGSSALSRLLFALRWKVGDLLGWDETDADAPTLRDRLPADLRGRPGPSFEAAPFVPLYLTGDEFAAEIANRTVHGVLHLSWVPDGDGYRGQMAVLVRPNGLLGRAYMAAIAPFRHLVVYPAMLRDIGRRWERERARRQLITPVS